jgi:hypothetical protein
MVAIKDAVSPDKTYHVVTVEKTEPPTGMEGGSWYRYVIALDEDETIVGNRLGTLEQVTQYANECAENISARAARGASTWASRRKK